ncbi:AraC family transcriptional regulator [Clostridium sp. UBA1056]|uniref:AraC family transcriptional regulator n=1 Tax=unclassified Clostridium TaxID=2614128 RepID=UPI003217BAB0
MEWLKKLSQSIDYIENNLDGTISYDEIAKIAGCSTYSFQRMSTYIAGILLSEYIRHRRMTIAAFEIQTKEIKIMDIPLKYGIPHQLLLIVHFKVSVVWHQLLPEQKEFY